MAICESSLWQVVQQIEPTQAQKESAASSHNYLRDLLRTGQMADRITASYLSGSYSRDTAIRPIDDVDIIFLINPSRWGPIYNLLRPPPEMILESFARAIRYRYPVSSVYGQRKSVRLELNHLDIDVVPAISKNQGSDFIYIPDRDAQDWILSSPKRHAEKASSVNQRRNGKFKPLVKLLKLWNGRLPSTASFRSFAIETLATRLFDYYLLESLQEAITFFFDFVAFVGDQKPHYKWENTCGVSLHWFSANIPDTAQTGSNIAKGLTLDCIGKFVTAAVRSRDKMLEAYQTNYEDVAWSRIRDALHF